MWKNIFYSKAGEIIFRKVFTRLSFSSLNFHPALSYLLQGYQRRESIGYNMHLYHKSRRIHVFENGKHIRPKQWPACRSDAHLSEFLSFRWCLEITLSLWRRRVTPVKLGYSGGAGSLRRRWGDPNLIINDFELLRFWLMTLIMMC
jgi:hypothetical protein